MVWVRQVTDDEHRLQDENQAAGCGGEDEELQPPAHGHARDVGGGLSRTIGSTDTGREAEMSLMHPHPQPFDSQQLCPGCFHRFGSLVGEEREVVACMVLHLHMLAC